MKKIDLKAYAKINLSIDVLDTLPNGYHKVSMVMQQVELHDNVSVKWIPGRDDAVPEIEIKCNLRYLPTDQRNLAYKAAALMMERYNQTGRFGAGKIRIDIKKQIPVGSGLAGGSADGAAVLIALNRLWGLSLSVAELCELGETLGADVPFCLWGQTGTTCARAEGLGTLLTPAARLDAWILLSKPSISVSTAEVYKGFDQQSEKGMTRPDNDALLEGLILKDDKKIVKNMVNVLENYTLKAYPSVVYTKNTMVTETNPVAALMSGSGPTIFGIYGNREHAEGAFEYMRAINKETFLTKTI